MAEAQPSANHLIEIPEDAEVIVYTSDPGNPGQIVSWSGPYKKCPYDTVKCDWYFLDTVEKANFIIIAY